MKALIIMLCISLFVSCSNGLESSESNEKDESSNLSDTNDNIAKNEYTDKNENTEATDKQTNEMNEKDNNNSTENTLDENSKNPEDAKSENENNEAEDSKETKDADGVVMIAKVLAVSKEYIEVEVIESEYAFGVYLVITSQQTSFISQDAEIISREEIKQNDIVSIAYNGQVMLSYPPQIVAKEIKIQ